MLGTIVRLGAAGSLLALTACGSSSTSASSGAPAAGSSSGAAAALTITAKDFGFSPTTVTWTPGETIHLTFTNTGHAEHSFTPDGGLPEVEAEGGASKSLTLTAPQSGTVPFHCKYHPTTMRGSIVISANGAAASSSDTTSSAAAGGYGN